MPQPDVASPHSGATPFTACARQCAADRWLAATAALHDLLRDERRPVRRGESRDDAPAEPAVLAAGCGACPGPAAAARG
ncbi:hypothetical protein I5Q34_12335 [Streptomyces sp. AV19]|uniref:hypothetical protein n=1 Tax=Streptomyces sp. AV19 TaxID=2793068 RepID=UPI0018FF0261|nr:hypothetical protein [Streptomyces sp. AV19]MBH1935056.1 hypothetical protein [Streptomyces sp. AV19]MDG4530989.1 hypothetical protein [Streptomyces sp. AV19]